MMTVYLFSSSYEIGQIINDHLLSCKYSSFVFQTKDKLFTSISNRKKLPDLLILDYTSFNHDFFNIYTYLSQEKKELPVIFFNDPCVTLGTRSRHWLCQLKLLCYKKNDEEYTDEELEKYEKLFKCVEEIVELEELAPYIKLMQKEKPLPDRLKKQTFTINYIKSNLDNDIYDFKNKAHLSGSLFYLLKILKQNSGIPLRSEDILEFYKKEGKQMTENSLKVLISRLRREIRNQGDCNFIISTDKGVYSFIGLKKS